MAEHPRRYKLILTYDIDGDVHDNYFQFVLGEMVPALQAQGLQMSGAWHTAYGDYPKRLVEFIADDQAALEALLKTPLWANLERRLRGFVTNYTKKTVPLRDDVFQF
ncbi:MAG: hypothetical protein IT317_14870 [Anaerolineales bacterium]|nr:hypothetical protein [Anaerolineales bacterium]